MSSKQSDTNYNMPVNFERSLMRDDFPDKASLDVLNTLKATELAAPDLISRLTTEQREEKARLIRSLYERTFFILDVNGYPVKLQMPELYEEKVGAAPAFLPIEWAELPKPEGLRGIRWPPKKPRDLTRADGSESCLGCEMISNFALDNAMAEYCTQLKVDEEVRFVDNDGTEKVGIVLHNASEKEALILKLQEDGHQDEGKTVTVRRPYWSVIVPEGRLSVEDKDEEGECICSVKLWREMAKRWHETLELKLDISNTHLDPSSMVDEASDTASIYENTVPYLKKVAVLRALHHIKENGCPVDRSLIEHENELIRNYWHALRVEQDAVEHSRTGHVGLFTKEYIPANRPVGEFIGVLKPDLSYYDEDVLARQDKLDLPESQMSEAEELQHTLDLPIGWLPVDKVDEDVSMPDANAEADSEPPCKAVYCRIDNYGYGNYTRFIQHSCVPNLELRTVRYGNVRMTVFFATRAVWPGEQLTRDLGEEYVSALSSGPTVEAVTETSEQENGSGDEVDTGNDGNATDRRKEGGSLKRTSDME
ncbi:hypothetical protein P280DRAFT_464787 [Massarina eburnea CBS 473.64]|uniref:SET domain-containing protein n=1 Tax=Massarina eburnea CBS 473.64 TaxID=1395130 RepID=A0A6A6SFA5_9PLEO|nr:hypothetical protein P280DRAFT_464787 [Massarina eburnea CBS 473.64]